MNELTLSSKAVLFFLMLKLRIKHNYQYGIN